MLNGVQWQSVEQFFQAYKYQDEKMLQKFQEKVPEKGTSAFEYGCFMARMGQERHPSFRKNWEQIKAEVMYRAKRAQIAQHPDLKEELIATGGNVIVHQDGNPFWAEWNGKCMSRIRDEVMPDGKHPQGDQKRDVDRGALVAAYARVIENEAFFADCPELVPYSIQDGGAPSALVPAPAASRGEAPANGAAPVDLQKGGCTGCTVS
jgi:hypothetical protein